MVCACCGCSKEGKTAIVPQAEITVESVLEESREEILPEPEVFIEPEIDLLMVGDILLHDNVQNSGKLADGTYNYDHLFANVKEDIEAADVAIVNQEVILGGRELGLSGYPAFNGAQEVGDALIEAGFDVILHATNHTLDKGKKGLLRCMDYWKTKHPQAAVLGVFDSQESYDNDIYVYEEDGLKIAILNYTYGTNGIPLPSDMPYAVALLEEEKVISDLKKAEELADFTIVCPHWGTEYQHDQSKEQEQWANLFLEYGVDLVIGTHPHYIQPIELLTNENGEEMLVYYSLGNFINSTSDSGRGTADRMIGGMAKVTVAKSEDGSAYIKTYDVEPLVTQLLYGPQEITTYELSDYTEELAAKNRILEKDSVFNLQFCEELCKDIYKDIY
jgi:poly-gamma-glutamate synthesis protein (capsule biosynthesis protein)